MNLKIICISIGILATELLAAQDQTTELSLEQVVKIARLESPDAQTARHSFRSAYWNYKILSCQLFTDFELDIRS